MFVKQNNIGVKIKEMRIFKSYERRTDRQTNRGTDSRHLLLGNNTESLMMTMMFVSGVTTLVALDNTNNKKLLQKQTRLLKIGG